MQDSVVSVTRRKVVRDSVACEGIFETVLRIREGVGQKSESVAGVW